VNWVSVVEWIVGIVVLAGFWFAGRSGASIKTMRRAGAAGYWAMTAWALVVGAYAISHPKAKPFGTVVAWAIFGCGVGFVAMWWFRIRPANAARDASEAAGEESTDSTSDGPPGTVG